jgi:hypothetical protein
MVVMGAQAAYEYQSRWKKGSSQLSRGQRREKNT